VIREITTRNPNKSEEARKKVCLEQLALDRQKLFLRWPFIGGVIMRMELIPVRDDRLASACSDGDNIFVDINFYAKLSKEERLFVLAHEVWHSVLLHFARLQDRDRDLFNIATDLEIHFALEDEKMREPFVFPHDPQWRGLSAEEIYEKLPAFQQTLMQDGNTQGTPGDAPTSVMGNGQSGFDKHIYQGDALPDKPSLPEGETEMGQGGDDSSGDKQNSAMGNGHSGFDKHVYQGDALPDKPSSPEGKPEMGQGACQEFVMDNDYNPSTSDETVEHSRSRTIAAAQQVERMQGTLPAGIKSLLDKLQKPSLPWRELLKQFVTTCYGGKRRWLPPARRHVWQDLYLPSMRDEALRAVVAIDTSGSTMGDLPVFFAELVSLMKSFGKFDLEVIQCDAEIQVVEHYSEGNLPPPDKKWQVKGFGGTDFRTVFEYIKKKMRVQPDLLLFFTDGYGTAPSRRPPYPVMWVLTGDGVEPASWGRVAHFKR
jgi:predicted metal-dependent peptidase